MLLPSALSAPLLVPRGLYAREDIVTTIVTTLAEESTTYVVVDGQTEETVVSGTPSVIEIAAAETTLDIYPLFTHTVADATTISVEIGPQALRVGGSEFTGNLNGALFTEIVPFTTTWTYPGTTLSLSFPSRQTAFIFSGAVSTEITIPPEHTHVTVDGIETAVDLPGFTTTIEVTDSTNVIVQLPEVTTTRKIYPETFEFTVHADIIHGVNGIKFCGTDEAQILTEQWGPGIGNPCIPGTTFAVTLPSQRRDLYLEADGLVTTFILPGITTTFVPEQTITFVKDGSTETSVIPAVVSTYTTTMSDTNVSSEESSMEPTITGPVTITVTEPGTTEPGTTEPGTTNDSTTIPGTTIPGTTEPGTEYTTTEPGSDLIIGQNVYTSDGSVYTTDVEVPITTPSGTASQPQTSTNVPTAPAGSLNTACSVVLGPMSGEDVALLEVIFSGTIDGTTYAQWLVNYASQLTRQIDNVAAQALADSGRQYTTAFDTIDVTGILGLASAAPMYTCYLSSLWDEALRNPQQYAKRAAPTQDEKTKPIVLFERRDDNTGGYNLAELLVDETDDLIAEMNSVIGGQIANPSNYANLFTRLDVRQLLSLASEAPVYTSGLSAAMQTALASYMATAPVNRVTTEVITLDNGRVETRTVTVCVENCDTVVAQSTRRPAAVQTVTTRPNVAVYTQVQNGVTYTHTIEV